MPGNALGCPSQGRMEMQALRPAERRALPRRLLPAHSPLFGQVCSECSSSTPGLAHSCSFITRGPRCPSARKPFLSQSDNRGWMPLPCAMISTDHSCLISHLDCESPRAGTVSHSPLYPPVQGMAGGRRETFDFDGGGITEQAPGKEGESPFRAILTFLQESLGLLHPPPSSAGGGGGRGWAGLLPLGYHSPCIFTLDPPFSG